MDRQIAFIPDKDQNSQGGLKHSQINQSIFSQPVIAELDIQEIQPFRQIPDYTCPTISSLPIVVISPTSHSCIDGWHLIQKAKSAGNSKIACYALYFPDHNQTEIAIQKVAIRTMPQGGTCSYAELVRNAGILFKMIMASAENPVVFSHGGARRGSTYADNTDNREDNIRALLAERLGKSVSTINKYLNHSEYLKSEAMQALVNAEVRKGFFEAVQPYKRKVIASLKSAQKSKNEISAAISETILSLLPEYQASGKGVITYNPTDQYESPSAEKQIQKDVASGPASLPKEFKHWSGNDLAAEGRRTTEVSVCQEIKTVGSELVKIIENKDLTVHQIAEIVSAQIVRLARLIQQLKHLDNLNTLQKEDHR